jgi:mitochondrial fission protein ELM1
MANDLRTFINSNSALIGASLIITPSRRTPLKWLEIFERNLDGVPYWIWNQKTKNPYPNLLKGVDAIIVCEDSISMASEACVMGKPVLIYPTGITKLKFKRFYQQLFARKHAQPFEIKANLNNQLVLNELDKVIEQLNKMNFFPAKNPT